MNEMYISLAINDKHIVCRAIVGIRIFLEFSHYFVCFAVMVCRVKKKFIATLAH